MAKLNINGMVRDVPVEADTPLLWVIREQIGLTNWKSGSSIIDPTWITVALPIGMALGASTNSWISDIVFRSRRYLAIISYMVLAATIAIAMEKRPIGLSHATVDEVSRLNRALDVLDRAGIERLHDE